MKIEKKISPLVQYQFPRFYEEDGPNFVAFVKAYYEWMETEGRAMSLSRSLPEITDVDDAPADFLMKFKAAYMRAFPDQTAVDERMLIKHVLDLYRAKGTSESYRLLFRIMFDEDVSLFFPGEHVFKPSDGKWTKPAYIEISDNPYLNSLAGRSIRSASARAVVESYTTKFFNNRMVNILYLSSVEGTFKFNQKIYCDDLFVGPYGNIVSAYDLSKMTETEASHYSLAITESTAPTVFGSLSAVGVINGGSGFAAGDELDVYGSGSFGKAKVVSTRDENGKVSFSLIDGGFGFSVNAVVTVTGGNGTGASFQVGDISNKQIYRVYTDKIVDYINTQLDITSSGMNLGVSGANVFTVGETVTSQMNVVPLDVLVVSGIVSNGQSLSNASLGLTNLFVARSEGSYVEVSGSESLLTSANLHSGIVLTSNSGASVAINNKFPKTTVAGSANVVTANTTVVYVNSVSGYFYPTETITGSTSGKTMPLTSVTRLTSWGLPNALGGGNLDSPSIGSALRVSDLEVGTISYIKNINPGTGYSANPTVDIVEPLIYDMMLPDGSGGYYGHDASVSAEAGSASGIVTAVEIVDSGFGYAPNETLILASETNRTAVRGTSIVDSHGVGVGSWEDNRSFVSDTMYVQDSYYYQPFAYEVVASRMLETYESVARELVHPSGLRMFGKYAVSSYVDGSDSASSLSFSQS